MTAIYLNLLKSHNINSIIINAAVYFILVQMIISLIFLKIENIKHFIYNNIIVLGLSVPFIIPEKYSHLSSDIKILFSSYAVLIFILTCTFLIKNYISGFKKLNFKKVIILVIFSATVAIIFQDIIYSVIFSSLQLFSLIIILFSLSLKRNFSIKILQILFSANIIYLFLTLIFFDHSAILISVLLVTSIINILLAFNKKNQVISYLNMFNQIKEQNRVLSHNNIKLTASINQCRKIISQKELEIFQISRHASLAEVTTGIAHELAQPLTGIKGISQNMIDDINYDELDKLQGVSDLTKICTLVDKSSTIIDHIRNFSKKSGFSKSDVNINKIILTAIDLVNNQLKNKDIETLFILDENIKDILGDNISLEQLIINIILNSKDAIVAKQQNSKDKEFEGIIRITTSNNIDSVNLQIEDNGIGIPEELQSKIWSPFFTSKKNNSGTGLGLSISSKIVKEHNGKIDLKSDEKGTSFTFIFPALFQR